jgi:predicted RNA-binding Zn-ribbon protein involved in translation (DUF1610 family)
MTEKIKCPECGEAMRVEYYPNGPDDYYASAACPNCGERIDE